MKLKTLFILLTCLVLNGSVYSQSLKAGSARFKYEYLPARALPATYTTYKVNAYSEATDGIPLNSRWIYIAEEYIKGLKNVSVPYSKSGIMIGGMVIGKDKEPTVLPSSIQISVVFNNIEMIDKQEFINKVTNVQTNQQEQYFTYKLSFKFAYSIRVKDVEKDILLLDTIINTPKTTLFPCDYRFDAFGNRQSFPGFSNKPDLDVDYNKSAKDLYMNSKAALAYTCMNETKAILKNLYGYYWDNFNVTIYRVKSKTALFDVCDSASTLVDNIFDSISYHTRNDKHLNWHTADIKIKAKKLNAIWKEMINNPAYSAEFKTAEDKAEFLEKIKKNLILGYLLTDDFDAALAVYNEVNVRPLGISMYDENMKALYALIKREQALYPKHKQVFNFN